MKVSFNASSSCSKDVGQNSGILTYSRALTRNQTGCDAII